MQDNCTSPFAFVPLADNPGVYSLRSSPAIWDAYDACVEVTISSGDDVTLMLANKYADKNDTALYNDYINRIQELSNTTLSSIISVYNAAIAEVEKERNERTNADILLGMGLDNLKEYSDSNDASVFSTLSSNLVSGLNALSADITEKLNNTADDLESKIDQVGDLVDDVRGALGQILDDPLGWIVRVFKVLFLEFGLSELAEFLADDPSKLPPAPDFKQLLIDNDLI